jgi:acyl carrier protein
MIGKLFGISQVGADDDFFELGGDSLKAIALVNKIRTGFDINISLSKLFEAQTIKQIAVEIENIRKVTVYMKD